VPLLLTRHPFANATFGLWQIAEEESFFRKDLPLSTDEEAELAALKGLRRLEWLAARWLLDKLSRTTERLPLAKDGFSKPFFPDNDRLLCSLSHSQGTVGVLLVEFDRAVWPEQDRCGCDIQVVVQKMSAIAPKFANEAEKAMLQSWDKSLQLDGLHLLWTAKESLYKAYGIKSLDFRAHLFVENVEWDGQQGHGRGRVEKADFKQAFELYMEKIQLPDTEESLIWTVCWPNN
jgi:4'-phosphopantetheinyl transferase